MWKRTRWMAVLFLVAIGTTSALQAEGDPPAQLQEAVPSADVVVAEAAPSVPDAEALVLDADALACSAEPEGTVFNSHCPLDYCKAAGKRCTFINECPIFAGGGCRYLEVTDPTCTGADTPPSDLCLCLPL